MDNLHIVKQGAISIPLFTHCSHVLIVAKSIYDSSIIFGYFYLYKKRIERKIPYRDFDPQEDRHSYFYFQSFVLS